MKKRDVPVSNYLIEKPKDFDGFKSFLVKHKRIDKEDVILREFKDFPYKIILQSYRNNLFKYSVQPYREGYCKIKIKDLISNYEMSLHIKNIRRENNV